MAYTKLEIYNMALRNLAVTTTLQSTEGNDSKIVALNTYYETAKNQMLKDVDWNFARAYRTMALTKSAVSDNPQYTHEYERPEDCLLVREVYINKPGGDIDFECASSYPTGKEVINTNAYSASLKYTRRINNQAFFSVDFCNTLGWYLAFLIADSIGMSAKKESALKMYSYELSKAIVANSNEGRENIKEGSVSWMDDRNG